MTYVIVWEFRIDPRMQAEFVKHYGPDGSWAQLFRRSDAYIRTELVRDVADRFRFITLDYWESQEAFNRFRELKRAEYERLDKEFEGLTETETRLGDFRTGEELTARS